MYINWLPVLGAAVLMFILGWIWYSNALFGRTWRALSGISEEYHAQMSQDKKRMWKVMSTYFVSLVLMAWALSYAVVFAGAYGVWDAIRLGFCLWVGFGIPATIGSVLWERKPWKYYGINVGYLLVALLAGTIILTLWF